LHLIDKLVDTSIGESDRPSCDELDKIPLPCSKEMWNAESETSWEIEYKKHLSTKKSRGMLTCGHLRQSSQLNMTEVNSDRVEDLGNWSTSIDRLGTVLLIAM